MTHQELYRLARTTLSPLFPDTAAFEAGQLFFHITGMSPHLLPLRGAEEVPADRVEQMNTLLERRLAHEPLQYLLGNWEFFGLPLRVGPGVLIPRADTETAVETALTLLANRERPTVADLCSGSGAIALAVWSQRPDAQVIAVEYSPDALLYLRQNVAALCCNAAHPVQVLVGDVLSPPDLPPLDLILSNPPYLSAQEMTDLQPEVQWEPAMALEAPEEGLLFYRLLPLLYRERLKPGGWMVFEVGYQQVDTVSSLLQAAGYEDIGEAQDLAGIRRCVYGRRGLE